MNPTVVYHSADFDGIFCREIARKFLPNAFFIGWDFGDPPLNIIGNDPVYILDLPVDKVFGADFRAGLPVGTFEHFIWIDHHKTSIETHPKDIPGYRIDGVAACRLAWQWFAHNVDATPLRCPKEHYVHRIVSEPLAVQLAGEYDVWDKRNPNAELFQHGLRSRELTPFIWDVLLDFDSSSQVYKTSEIVLQLLEGGKALQYARAQEYKDVITQQGFDLEFEGLNFLACNSHELDIRSHLFEAGLKPHHDAMLGFTWGGKDWRVSMYGVDSRDIDLSSIAKKHGGGGHKKACGFRARNLPFAL